MTNGALDKNQQSVLPLSTKEIELIQTLRNINFGCVMTVFKQDGNLIRWEIERVKESHHFC